MVAVSLHTHAAPSRGVSPLRGSLPVYRASADWEPPSNTKGAARATLVLPLFSRGKLVLADSGPARLLASTLGLDRRGTWRPLGYRIPSPLSVFAVTPFCLRHG